MLAATVTGRLGQDAELKFTPNGDAVCTISIASSRKSKGKEDTTWIRATIWGKRGETLSQYLTKGTAVAVVGELSVREYDKRDGSRGFSLELRVNELDFMGGARSESGQGQERRPKPVEREDSYRSSDSGDY